MMDEFDLAALERAVREAMPGIPAGADAVVVTIVESVRHEQIMRRAEGSSPTVVVDGVVGTVDEFVRLGVLPAGGRAMSSRRLRPAEQTMVADLFAWPLGPWSRAVSRL
jgi:hypothetical protein